MFSESFFHFSCTETIFHKMNRQAAYSQWFFHVITFRMVYWRLSTRG